ncbi:MAG: hypothetical protein WC242_04435 [Candidatus Paceibacterota bacterium]|jgi:hypothetical protein
MEKSPERSKTENFEISASKIIEDDYFNEYLTLFQLLVYDKGEKNRKPVKPKGFSQRYPDMKFYNSSITATETERQQIEELDRLAIEVNRLMDELTLNRTILLEKIIRMLEICNKPDLIELCKKKLESKEGF